MNRYIKAIIFSRFSLFLSLILSAAYDFLWFVGLVMNLFVYDNADEITYISCILNVLFTSCFLGVMIVLFHRYIKQIHNVEKAYDGDIKAHLEECDNIISSRHFFFHDHFISFDNPVICGYDEIKTIYNAYPNRSGGPPSGYNFALMLNDGRIFNLFCSSVQNKKIAVEELKKYALTARFELWYQK